MSKFCAMYTSKSLFFPSVLLFMLGTLVLSSSSQAVLTDFNNDKAWDDNPGIPHFILNGTPLAESKASQSTNLIDGTFNWRQELVRDKGKTIKSIAFNGAAAENPHIHQHVFSYTQYDDPSSFISANTTSHTRTFILGPEDFGLTRLKNKKVKLSSNIILDGSLLFVKDPAHETTYRGMAASFDVKVFQEYAGRQGDMKKKQVFSGQVRLKPRRDGEVRVVTRGNIKKKHIDSVDIIEGNLFQINFDDKSIPYKTRIKVGQEFSLITEVTGISANKGYGTGAEVIFGPGLPGEIPVPTIPAYYLSNKIFPVPEPATLILLAGGGILMLRPRARKMRAGRRK